MIPPFETQPPDGTVLRITDTELVNMPGHRVVRVVQRHVSPFTSRHWYYAGSDLSFDWDEVLDVIRHAETVEVARWTTPGDAPGDPTDALWRAYLAGHRRGAPDDATSVERVRHDFQTWLSS